MKRSTRAETSGVKQNYAKKVEELVQEKKALQKEVDELRLKFSNTSLPHNDVAEKLKTDHLEKLNYLEEQVSELKKKLEAQSQLLKQNQKINETAKQMQDQIQRIKAQKVQLQRTLKQESAQFRSWKLLQEKEVLQLKKEVRRTEYEMNKLLALNKRQKMVLLRKTEEASMATKWLKELLKPRKALSNADNGNVNRLQAIEHAVEIRELENELRYEYARQTEERVRMAEEAAKLKEEADRLIQKNLQCLLQDKEEICRQKDSEIRDLNEEVVKLSILVRRLEIQKAEFIHMEKPQGPGSSIINSGGSNIELLEDMGTSELEHSGMGMKNSDWTMLGKEPPEKQNFETGGCSSSEGFITTMGKDALGACCSCSKKSLCKTTKCKCRANGETCGTSCGCASVKCTNREAVMVKNLIGLPESTADCIENCSDTFDTLKHCILASQDTMLIQSGLREEKPLKENNNCEPRKMPLSDIGNIQIKPNQRKKRGSKKKH